MTPPAGVAGVDAVVAHPDFPRASLALLARLRVEGQHAPDGARAERLHERYRMLCIRIAKAVGVPRTTVVHAVANDVYLEPRPTRLPATAFVRAAQVHGDVLLAAWHLPEWAQLLEVRRRAAAAERDEGAVLLGRELERVMTHTGAPADVLGAALTVWEGPALAPAQQQ